MQEIHLTCLVNISWFWHDHSGISTKKIEAKVIKFYGFTNKSSTSIIIEILEEINNYLMKKKLEILRFMFISFSIQKFLVLDYYYSLIIGSYIISYLTI